MIGSFLTRGLVLIFGYACPAYECYKSVEMNKPNIEQLRFWCKYWILVAGLMICERVCDAFIGWVPMYDEAKVAFVIYLWWPGTKGATYVYDSFFRPYIAKHETEIDRNLLELRTRAGDMALLYWQKATSRMQIRVFDILQYIASQSTPKQPPQPQKQVAGAEKPVTSHPKDNKRTFSMSSSEVQKDITKEEETAGHAEDAQTTAAPVPDPAPPVNEQKPMPVQAPLESSTPSSSSNNEKVIQSDPPLSATSEGAQLSLGNTIMVEPGRVTRSRNRLASLAASNS